MSSKDPFADVRRQQEQLRRQQEQFSRQQREHMHRQQAEAAELQRRKRRQREAQMQSGGVNIVDSDLAVSGDIVGRDKVQQVSATYPRDEKSGLILLIQRVFTFIFAFMVSTFVFGLFATFIFGGLSLVIGLPESAIPVFGVIVLLLALVFAFVTASSISRYRD